MPSTVTLRVPAGLNGRPTELGLAVRGDAAAEERDARPADTTISRPIAVRHMRSATRQISPGGRVRFDLRR